MYTYSFTGTRHLKDIHKPLIDSILVNDCRLANKFITGACPGVDAYIAKRLYELYPDKWHQVIVPGVHIEGIEWVIPDSTKFDIIKLPRGASTKYRNTLLVQMTDFLFGFPLYTERRQPRSGSWATIRLARKSNKPYQAVILEGNISDLVEL